METAGTIELYYENGSWHAQLQEDRSLIGSGCHKRAAINDMLAKAFKRGLPSRDDNYRFVDRRE